MWKTERKLWILFYKPKFNLTLNSDKVITIIAAKVVCQFLDEHVHKILNIIFQIEFNNALKRTCDIIKFNSFQSCVACNSKCNLYYINIINDKPLHHHLNIWRLIHWQKSSALQDKSFLEIMNKKDILPHNTRNTMAFSTSVGTSQVMYKYTCMQSTIYVK